MGWIRDSDCTRCRLSQITEKPVCQLGVYTDSEVMVIMEQPGDENHWLIKDWIDDLQPAVGYAVSCNPEPGRPPTKSQITHCRHWIDYRIKKCQPRYVLLMGNPALQSITGNVGIAKQRGKPFEQNGVIYLPCHTAKYAAYDEKQRPLLSADLDLFMRIIEFGGIPREEALDYTVVDDLDVVEELLDALSPGTETSIDLETTGLYPWHEEIVSMQFGVKGKQFILPMEAAGVWGEALLDRILTRLDKKIKHTYNVFHNGLFDLLFLRVKHGLKWRNDFDTMMASHSLDENSRHGLKYLAQVHLGAPDYDVDLKTKTTWNPKNALYAAHDVYYTLGLYHVFRKRLELEPGVERLFYNLTMPACNMFVEVRYNGVYVDQDRLDEAEDYLIEVRDLALSQLREYANINWSSPAQVGDYLFNTLGLKVIDRTKGGGPSTSESVMQRINHPVAGLVLQYRAAEKQIKGFIHGWRGLMHKGYLHPSFKLHGTVTGRLSCEEPNLQQVPRDPRIRSLITAPPGWTLLQADLSQAELRFIADASMDPNLVSAFINGIDVHHLTGVKEIARVGGLKELVLSTTGLDSYADSIDAIIAMGPDEAAKINGEWKVIRKKSKAVNFGYSFGMWWRKFAIYSRDNYGVEVTDQQAKDSRIAFFATYPGIEKWHQRQRRKAKLNGYVTSLVGRKRRLPDAQSGRDDFATGAALRQAINSPIQGVASDWNILAMLQLWREFPRSVIRLCGAVHDAILVRVRDDWLDRVESRLLEIMKMPDAIEQIFEVTLKVPMLADAKRGPWS